MIKFEKPEELKAETEKRIKRMKAEFAKPPRLKVFKNTEGYNQIIAQVGIPFMSKCEHHEIGFHGFVSIAYIPDKYVVGLSKLGRVAEFYLNPTLATIQEKATHQILNYLKKELKPKGLMVIIKGEHACITHRGVKKPSLTITSAIYGIFDQDASAKSEFLSLVNAN